MSKRKITQFRRRGAPKRRVVVHAVPRERIDVAKLSPALRAIREAELETEARYEHEARRGKEQADG